MFAPLRGVNPGARSRKGRRNFTWGGVGHEGQKYVRFNALFFLMVDRPDRQVSFEVLERFLDMNQLGIQLPHLRWVMTNDTEEGRAKNRRVELVKQ